MDRFFHALIRIVFLVAYGAFLWASIHHIAYFFSSFESTQSGPIGSYTLAISIDVTALVMTIGVMFFRKSMDRFSFGIVWAFIIGLTAFSWIVNWEYAVQFQNANLSHATQFQMINPILASSFAFLNLVYSLVGEFFGSKGQTVDDLDKEIERLTGMKGRQEQLRELRKGTGFIASVTNIAKDTKKAVAEVFTKDVQEPQKERDTGPIANPHAIENMVDEDEENSLIEDAQEDASEGMSEQQEMVSEDIQDTHDEVPIVHAQKTQKASTSKRSSDASVRVHKVLKSNPSATVTQIVDKAKVSRGYASQIRKQWISEQQEQMA